VDILAEAAADGAIYVEVRFGADRLIALPDFMGLFRQAEERVQARHPRLRAEAIGYVDRRSQGPKGVNRLNGLPVALLRGRRPPGAVRRSSRLA
jgi:hypothetical protein